MHAKLNIKRALHCAVAASTRDRPHARTPLAGRGWGGWGVDGRHTAHALPH